MILRLTSTAAAAFISCVALVMPAQAEVPITINGGVGYWIFDSDRDLDDSTTPWVSAEWAFTDKWAGELMYAKDQTDYGRGFGTDVSTWQLSMLYYGGSYMDSAGKFRPYLAFGAGESQYESAIFNSVETTVNAGVGVRWMMTPRFGVRVESRLLRSLDENQNDWLLNAGLNYYFGKVEPDVVAVAAPVDSDGDGVMDDRDQCPGTAPGTRVDSVGCPLPVTQVASMKLKVNFAFDSAQVEEHYFSSIAELAAFLQRFGDVQVDVEGHTDDQGEADYNQNLSERRAQAVVDLLVNEHGIAASRLNAVGYGETRPVAENGTLAGHAENRRVMATLEVEYEE